MITVLTCSMRSSWKVTEAVSPKSLNLKHLTPMIKVLTCSMPSTWKVPGTAKNPKPYIADPSPSADLQHALHLEGDGGGEAEVQLAVQAGLAGDAAGAHHAAAPRPAASHLQDGAGRGLQAGAAAARGGGGMATRGTPACCVALHWVIPLS